MIPDSDQSIRIETKYTKNEYVPAGLDPELADNHILATAIQIAHKCPDKIVKVITKDINLRVKCDALGLIGEDYYKDHLLISKMKPYEGQY